MVIHKSETFRANVKNHELSMLSLLSRGCCDCIFAVFIYIFFKGEISLRSLDIMISVKPANCWSSVFIYYPDKEGLLCCML